MTYSRRLLLQSGLKRVQSAAQRVEVKRLICGFVCRCSSWVFGVDGRKKVWKWGLLSLCDWALCCLPNDLHYSGVNGRIEGLGCHNRVKTHAAENAPKRPWRPSHKVMKKLHTSELPNINRPLCRQEYDDINQVPDCPAGGAVRSLSGKPAPPTGEPGQHTDALNLRYGVLLTREWKTGPSADRHGPRLF